MSPVNILLYLLCFFVKHVIANTAKVSIVRQESIADTGSKLSDVLVQSEIACSSLCLRDLQCELGHYHPVSKRCSLYSSNTLVSNPEEEGIVLIIESRNLTVDDCSGTNKTGVVDLTGIGPVYCENAKNGGGWTVFQRRFDGSLDFYRDWDNYTDGFGDMNGEFWLCLKKLHKLTSSGDYMMRVELEDFENNKAHANYSSFRIGNESMGYVLDFGGYSGDAGDSMGFENFHNDMKYSTMDRDNDRSRDNCAELCKGAWWYNSCMYSNLNGRYLGGPYSIDLDYPSGIVWNTWRGPAYSLKATKMMLRRI